MFRKNLGASLVSLLVVVLVVIALGSAAYYIWTQFGPSLGVIPPTASLTPVTPIQKSPSPTIIPSPSPTPAPLKSGKETYLISQGSETKGPRIYELSLDPLDIKNGQQQSISVKVSDPSSVRSVKINFKSDNKSRTLTLNLSEGTAQDGAWKTSWTLDDSVDFKYSLEITATGGSGTSTVIVAPRQ